MKTKLFTVFSMTALLAFTMFSVAQAQETEIDDDMRVGAPTERGERGEPMLISAPSKEQDREQKQDRERTNEANDISDDEDTESATSSKNKERKEITADEHRSDVATFVKSLLSVADRDGGIGSKVREVAQAQNDLASTTASAIEKVSKKGKIATFFFGSDYKNLGQLRSELVETEKNIEELRGLISDATGTVNKTELEAQIQALEETKTKVETFVTDHEDSFSLFGWVARMFAK